MTDITIQRETATIKASLKKLRPHFPGLPDTLIISSILQNGAGELSPASLKTYARTKRRFTTAEVMQHFQVDKYKVAASVAVLRQEGVLEPDSPKKTKDGFSRWRYSA